METFGKTTHSFLYELFTCCEIVACCVVETWYYR